MELAHANAGGEAGGCEGRETGDGAELHLDLNLDCKE
jgi:hypothetical protein